MLYRIAVELCSASFEVGGVTAIVPRWPRASGVGYAGHALWGQKCERSDEERKIQRLVSQDAQIATRQLLPAVSCRSQSNPVIRNPDSTNE